MSDSRVKGLDNVLSNLSEAIDGIKGNTADGVALAGEFVKGESQELTSIAEVDGGTLINSAFSKEVGTKDKPAVQVGYTAEYAGAVHEMPEGTNWNRPGAENQFLEKAVVRHISEIINIIARIAGRSPK